MITSEPSLDLMTELHLEQSQTFPADHLLKILENLHDYLYANEGLSAQQTLEEIVKILFLKLVNDYKEINYFFITDTEINRLTRGQTIPDFSERINHLFTQIKLTYPTLFEPDDRLRISSLSLAYIVHKLQDISLKNYSQDVKGLAFQKFLSHREKDGRGQFFTPEPVRDFCVEIIQPQPDETIIDPACGSGGFLISALKYFKHNFRETDVKNIITHNLYGLDINKSIARIAQMQLLLEANVKINICCTNSLDNQVNFLEAAAFDIVLTNPPFGTGGKITNHSILQQFDLGYKWIKNEEQYQKTNQILKGQTAEILFIERSLNLLKEGGRLGIVLPNGLLENSSLEYLRFYLKQKAKILAIINLPQETFIPFGTGVKTSLLFLQKESLITNNNYYIFWGKVKKLGYQGNKNATPLYQKDLSGNLIKDSTGKPILDQDFTNIIKEYRAFCQESNWQSENSFVLNFNQLKGRFDYDFYLPNHRQLIINSNLRSVPLGDICDIIKTKSKRLKNPQLEVEYIELSDLNSYGLEIINTTNYLVHQLPSRASYELKTGDIITAIAGNSVGTKKHTTALVTAEFNGCICSNGLRVLRNFQIDPYFLLYFFRTELFLNQMFRYRTGAAIPNVSDRDLANIMIYLPEDQIIQEISEKMQRFFQLKQAAKREFNSINFQINSV